MTQRDPSTLLGLKPFLDQLEVAMGALSHNNLKALLMEQARTLRPPDRGPFLARFQAPASTDVEQTGKSTRVDEELLSNVNKFVADVKSGMYCDGWGYDHEIGDERAFGDESWVDEMDALFDRAEAEFLDGNIGNAGAAYGTLLESFGLSEDAGTFSGPHAPDEMVATDINEAKARYFRCLYENSQPEERGPRLAHAVQVLEYVGSRQVGVQAMCEAAPQTLPGLDAFLTEWIATLKKVRDPSGFGWGYTAKWLLREAVCLADGVDGLAALARAEGDTHPDAFMDWVRALIDERRFQEATQAAELGVRRIVHPEAKAEMADRLAEMAADQGKIDLAVDACRTAWRSDANMLRLLLYLDAGNPGADEQGERVEAEYGHPDAFEPALSPRMAAMLEICSGRYMDAMERLKKAKPLGWSSESHVGLLVLPFALLAAVYTRNWASQPVLAPYIKSSENLVDGLHSLCELQQTAENGKGASVLSAFREALTRNPLTKDADKGYVSTARSAARKRVRAVVSNCHRGAYERAAILAVAVSEAEAIVLKRRASRLLAQEMYAEFSRHSAFRRELVALMPSLTGDLGKKAELQLLRGGTSDSSDKSDKLDGNCR